MQLSTSTLYDRSSSAMTSLQQQANKIQQQITSTKRLTAPSDDVVAYQRLATIHQASADDKATGSNITFAQGLLQQSDTTLSSVESQLQHAQELITQAGNGTLNADNRKTIADQIRGIVTDLVSLANTKDSRGQPLFGAATGDSAVTRAADGNVAFSGTGTPAAIPIGSDTVQATDSAARVFGGIAIKGGTSDTFAILSAYADALDAGSDVGTATGTAKDGVGAALTQVQNVHAAVGARAARLDIQAQQLKDTATNRETDRSALEDTDTSAAIVDLQKTITILSATQASFTKLSQLSLFDYLR